MSGRTSWTPEDDAALRSMHQRDLPFKAIARRLSRGRKATEDRARRLGLPLRRTMPRPLEADVIRLHAAGLNDCEIARRLGCWPSSVRNARARLKLPAIGVCWLACDRRRHRLKVRAALFANRGVRSLGEVRWQLEQVESVKGGWPPCSQAMRALLEAIFIQPAGARELAPRLGMTPNGVWQAIKKARKAGWIVDGPRTRAGTVYDLSADVRARHERRCSRPRPDAGPRGSQT